MLCSSKARREAGRCDSMRGDDKARQGDDGDAMRCDAMLWQGNATRYDGDAMRCDAMRCEAWQKAVATMQRVGSCGSILRQLEAMARHGFAITMLNRC
jgi:hypothetical protein